MARQRSDEDVAVAADRLLVGVSRLGSRMRAERPRDGLTLAMQGVLLRLQYRETMTAGELAQSMGVVPQSMTRILAGMWERGLVERRPDPNDARQTLVSLTPMGTDALDADAAPRRDWLAAAMEAELTTAERDLLRIAGDLMGRLADHDG